MSHCGIAGGILRQLYSHTKGSACSQLHVYGWNPIYSNSILRASHSLHGIPLHKNTQYNDIIMTSYNDFMLKSGEVVEGQVDRSRVGGGSLYTHNIIHYTLEVSWRLGWCNTCAHDPRGPVGMATRLHPPQWSDLSWGHTTNWLGKPEWEWDSEFITPQIAVWVTSCSPPRLIAEHGVLLE